MIESEVLEGCQFQEKFLLLEREYVSELENMIFSQLLQFGQVEVGDKNEILEFSGRTNYKIRVRRPNRNVWSVPLKNLQDAIRKVLREGEISREKGAFLTTKNGKPSPLETPLKMLLESIPWTEFEKRSFVGNAVQHEVYGTGFIQRISESGNVEIEFGERKVLLKPGFFELKTAP